MLARLRHRAVGRADHQDRAVHLGRTGDHVLDVVGVTRAVDVRIVTVVGLVLDVGHRDRHGLGSVTDGAAFGNVGITFDLGFALLGQDLQQRRGQGCFAMVNVTDGADVGMWLGTFKLLFGHVLSLL